MVIRDIRNYKIKAVSKAEADKIEKFMNEETYENSEFRKYFNVWMVPNFGIFYFIKEKFFVSRDGKTNYAIALLEYGSGIKNIQEVPTKEL